MRPTLFFLALLLYFLGTGLSRAEIDAVWLTFAQEEPSRIMVNWTSTESGGSTVYFGSTEDVTEKKSMTDEVTLHHVEIPVPTDGANWFYRVETGDSASPVYRVKSFSGPELRIVVVGNLHGDVSNTKWDAIEKENVHLFATAGDNVSRLHTKELVGNEAKTNIEPFRKLIRRRKDFFATTPFMPVLGNHDREIRSRGSKENPPTEPVYDVDATAFRTFFPLPNHGWCWKFNLPDYGLRLLALDLNHISDYGTLLQTSHPYQTGSEQFRWFDAVSREKHAGFTVVLQNERNASIRTKEKNAWHEMFRRTDAVVAGFGHYAERAESGGVRYFNTSIKGTGDVYKDPESKFLESRNNYLLLRCALGGKRLTIQLKDIESGEVLDEVFSLISTTFSGLPRGKLTCRNEALYPFSHDFAVLPTFHIMPAVIRFDNLILKKTLPCEELFRSTY